jgi:hypothetical protein
VTRTMKTRILFAAVAAFGIASVVTGCSAGGSDDATGAKPTAKPSAAATQAGVDADGFTDPVEGIEQAEAACEGGVATIDIANKEVTLAADCPTVKITASNSVIHIGSVDHLTIDGSINDVDAKSVGEVTVTGGGNRLTSDNEPKQTDKGEQNVFRTR